MREPWVHLGQLWTNGDPGLRMTTACMMFAFKVHWHTQLDDENCFARWLLTPHEPRDQPAPE
ncbi:hypothetical protein ACWCSD_00085 [Nonomuraea sp. NPDC001684]